MFGGVGTSQYENVLGALSACRTHFSKQLKVSAESAPGTPPLVPRDYLLSDN
jgi:hypothetical protein